MWTGTRPRREWIALAIFCVLLIFAGVAREVRRRAELPDGIDLGVYITAGNVLAVGGDPYRMDTMRAAGTFEGFPYTYPPHTIPLARSLAGVDPHLALGVWIGIKVAALFACGLVALNWLGLARRLFLPFLALATTGFGNGGFHDLRMGNLALIETAVGSLMFAALLKGAATRSGVLGALLVAVKPHFLLFSLPGLLVEPKRVARGLGVGLLFVVPIYLFGVFRYPTFFRNYPSRLAEFDPKLMMGDSLRRDAITWTQNDSFATLLFGVLILAVIAGVVYAVRRLRAEPYRDGVDRARLLVPLTAVATVLVNPRLPYYSNAVIAIPLLTLFADLNLTPLSIGLFLLVAALVPGMHPWFVTLPLFMAILLVIRQRTKRVSGVLPAQ
ncbi:DUF2029 domain-containing protein [bacterium]|nr:MAG: DUF2029 domain-containing protein [bacterium]